MGIGCPADCIGLATGSGEGDGGAACDLEAEGGETPGSGHRAIAAQFRRHAGGQLAALVAGRTIFGGTALGRLRKARCAVPSL